MYSICVSTEHAQKGTACAKKCPELIANDMRDWKKSNVEAILKVAQHTVR